MAAPSQSEKGSFDPQAWWTAPKRNFRSSARLHLQHSLFQRTLNNQLLHPDIEAFAASQSTPLRIADIGCGNGIWLLDLHAHLTSIGVAEFTIDGYDINPTNFPSAHTIPSNISLKTADMKQSHPEIEGKYDIVHLRAWTSCVEKDDPSPTIAMIHKLLRPGGFLQWEESRFDLQSAFAPPGVPKPMTDMIVGMLKRGGAKEGEKPMGNTFNFLSSPTFESCLEKGGFTEVRRDEKKKRPADLKAWTEDYLMVWEEIPDLIPDEQGKKGFIQLFMGSVKETEQGVVIHHEAVVMMTAKKPSS